MATAALALTLFASAPASAAPGDLDRSFGADGRITLSLAHGGSQGNAVLVQPNGRIVVGGWAYSRGFALMRLLRDGSLDRSFGGDGVVTTNFPTGPAVVSDLALDGHGRIVAAGLSEAWMAVARYLPDGSLDPTFGRGGMVTARYRDSQTSAEGVAIDGRGRVIAAGTASDRRWVLARFSSGGRLDQRFGDRGWATIDFGPGEEAARDLALTPNGRIVVAGTGRQRLALARFHRDGSLDRRFGSGGTVVTPGTARGTAAALALLPNGDLLAAGHSASAFLVRRFLPSGRPDPTYGTDGSASGPSVDGLAFDVVVSSDRSAVVVGSQFERFTVARYLPGGSPDPGFGNEGVVQTRFPNYGPAEGVALMPNQRPVVVGQTGDRIGLARYDA
ncbi:MAG: delta-60 repeat domain-containing protein [Actinomycetota bacterium]